jgi:signal transduction histidine kinase
MLIASVVVLPGAIYGVLAVASSRAALARASGLQLASEAQNAADRLATAVRSERDALTTAARQDVMREIRIGDLDKRISSFLASLRHGCAACLDLYVIDREGRVVAASDPARLGRRVAASPPPLEGPLDDPDAARPSLRLAAPIADPDDAGKRLGTLVALLDWARVTDAATRTRENLVRAGIDADVLVLDANGTVIGGAARHDPRWPLGTRVDADAWRDTAPSGATRIAEVAGMLVGRARMPGDLPPWTVLIAQPSSQAFAAVRRMAVLLASALALTLLAALAIALVAAQRATRPLAELTAAARDIGRGTATPAIAVRSRDEIGTLAAAFNRMTDDLGRAERRLVDAAKFAFVGQLAAGVAHEVRTPLGVLRSSTQLLERALPAPDDEARELLHLLRDEVDRIEGVVSGLLELGRPRELTLEAAALGQIVFRAVDFAEVQARAKGVTIERHPIAPDPRVACDPELVYQVALNLLVNAVQILPTGGRIAVTLLPPHEGLAGFEVRDDGPGIPADLQATLFQPFATRREGGVGLGLTFVQRVVLEHHGRLTVRDAPERGTVFRVEIPVAEDPA